MRNGKPTNRDEGSAKRDPAFLTGKKDVTSYNGAGRKTHPPKKFGSGAVSGVVSRDETIGDDGVVSPRLDHGRFVSGRAMPPNIASKNPSRRIRTSGHPGDSVDVKIDKFLQYIAEHSTYELSSHPIQMDVTSGRVRSIPTYRFPVSQQFVDRLGNYMSDMHTKSVPLELPVCCDDHWVHGARGNTRKDLLAFVAREKGEKGWRDTVEDALQLQRYHAYEKADLDHKKWYLCCTNHWPKVDESRNDRYLMDPDALVYKIIQCKFGDPIPPEWRNVPSSSSSECAVMVRKEDRYFDAKPTMPVEVSGVFRTPPLSVSSAKESDSNKPTQSKRGPGPCFHCGAIHWANRCLLYKTYCTLRKLAEKPKTRTIGCQTEKTGRDVGTQQYAKAIRVPTSPLPEFVPIASRARPIPSTFGVLCVLACLLPFATTVRVQKWHCRDVEPVVSHIDVLARVADSRLKIALEKQARVLHHEHHLSYYSPDVTFFTPSFFSLTPRCRKDQETLHRGLMTFCLTREPLVYTVQTIVIDRGVLCEGRDTAEYVRLVDPTITSLCLPDQCYYVDDICFEGMVSPTFDGNEVMDPFMCLHPYVNIDGLLRHGMLAVFTNASLVRNVASASFVFDGRHQIYCPEHANCSVRPATLPMIPINMTELTYVHFLHDFVIERLDSFTIVIEHLLARVNEFYWRQLLSLVDFVLRHVTGPQVVALSAGIVSRCDWWLVGAFVGHATLFPLFTTILVAIVALVFTAERLNR